MSAPETTPQTPQTPQTPVQPDEAADEGPLLHEMWTYYAHASHSDDWTLASYRRLGDVSSAREYWMMHDALEPHLPECMLFVMREHVFPCWDDPANLKGGCLSLKLPAAQLRAAWLYITQRLLGETLLVSGAGAAEEPAAVNGLSVSPKRNFHILKLWLREDKEWRREHFRLPAWYAGEALYKRNLDSIQSERAGAARPAAAT